MMHHLPSSLENAALIHQEMDWLRQRVAATCGYNRLGDDQRTALAAPPDLSGSSLPFAQLVQGHASGSLADRVLLGLALSTHFAPGTMEVLLQQGQLGDTPIDYGGYRSMGWRGVIPTLDTLVQVLSGGNPVEASLLKHLHWGGHALVREGLVRLEQISPMDPVGGMLILPSRELLDLCTTGRHGEPDFGPSFPAQRIETSRGWGDLVLSDDTLREIQDILSWIQHEHTVMKAWKLEGRLAPGFRALFHGPPGTGKTFTATLLGKATGREVYRIDLSMVVSKYIGETEKNLRAVFDKAQSRGWILFFDEADALFGKRTDVSDSKDRYANQEVSYLLQRVESFDGVVILATNNRDNMDKAFTRRFQVVVNFAMPSASERLSIWQRGLPEDCPLSPDTNLTAIAERYELAGGSIMNVVRYCALRAAVRGDAMIYGNDILDGIRVEYKKAGRILS